MEQTNYVQPKPESRKRKFWRVVFGSMLGFCLSYVFIIILSFSAMFSMIAALTSTSSPLMRSNSILKITLEGEIAERGEDNPFENTAFENYSSTATGLDDILNCISTAADDPNIKGISLELKNIAAGAATLTEIRNALGEFKNSGKFIYAYSESYSQRAYYIASVADKVYMSNMGMVEWKGLAIQLMFYKGLIEKLDADIQIIRHGTFKSAVEPYFLDKMSDNNREQMTLLVDNFWSVYLKDVAASRNIPEDSLNYFADQLMCMNAQVCKKLGMVDEIIYPIEYQDFLRKELGLSEKQKINTTTINAYKGLTTLKRKAENIAIIYAYGSIYDGKGEDKNIYSENLCKEIRKAYENDKVKAIVFRVNSGGGSAPASEMIWNEIEQAKAAGKKVVTSMGDYAASGGYYISCNSDYIVAQPNTLTGSIGVFGMIPSFQRMLKNKLGITLDVAKSNSHADYITGLGRPFDEFEIKKMELYVEDVYDIFTNRVAAGRNIPIKSVLLMAEGRVWSGEEAKKLGLVDQLGNIDDAIAKAAELAGISNYGIICYPEPRDFFTRLFATTDSEAKIEKALQQQLGDLYSTYKGMKSLSDANPIQTRLPFEIVIND